MSTPHFTGAQLATAFDGKLERRGFSLLYHVATLLVAGMMILLPLVYFAIIAAVAWLVYLHATHSVGMLTAIRGRGVIIMVLLYITPIIAGAILVVFMILPMFWKSQKQPRRYWVDRREEPLLYAYLDKLCDVMRAPRPERIDVVAEADASAHIDNGLFGLFRRRLVLTIGLPLVGNMDLRQLTGVMAHELGHFAQGGSMRLGYLIHRIHFWFVRMAYEPSGVDDFLTNCAESDSHWAINLIGLVAKLGVWLTRLVLILMTVISHFFSMHLSRRAEFDADRQAARIVGGQAMADGLSALPAIGLTTASAIEFAKAAWQKRRLPDDLVMLSVATASRFGPKDKAEIASRLANEKPSWFDTHPPLRKRMQALKALKMNGVLKLDGPASVLFKDLPELCKMATLDFYSAVLGNALRPEHLVPVTFESRPAPAPAPAATAAPAPKKPAATASATSGSPARPRRL